MAKKIQRERNFFYGEKDKEHPLAHRTLPSRDGFLGMIIPGR